MPIVDYLHKQLLVAVKNIAPEKAHKLTNFQKVRIVYTHVPRFTFNVDGKLGIVKISPTTYECIWFITLFHLSVYRKINEGAIQLGVPACPKAIGVESEMLAAICAIQKMLGKPIQSYPPSMHMPSPNLSFASWPHVANELTLGAVCYILFHELGHIQLGHEGASEIADEVEADIYAYDWLFDKIDDENSKIAKKRALIITNSHLIEVVRDIWQVDFSAKGHPRSMDRMLNFFDRYGINENHIAVSYAAAVVNMHWDAIEKIKRHENRFKQPRVYSSFRESIEELWEFILKNN